MSFVTKIIVAVLLLDLLWWWAADWWLRKTGWSGRARLLHSVFLALQLVALLAVIFTRRSALRVDLPQFVTAAVYLWHLLLMPVIAPLLLVALLFLIARWIYGLAFSKREPSLSGNTEEHALMNRRGFLSAAAVFAPQLLGVSLTGIALRQLDDFRVRRITVPIANLPPALEGLTIAQVSDTHVGRFTTGAVLRRIAEAANDLRADLTLLTGDLINGALHEIPEAIEMVRRLEARSGVYVIEGNHDLFQGRAAFGNRIREAGISLLVNETARLVVRGHPVDLLGLRWGAPGEAGRRPRGTDEAIANSLRELLATRRSDAFPILLAHHPHAFDAAIREGLPLTLAGHSHGGQLMLNEETGFGPVMFRYWSGLYSRGESHLVVSNGVGNWFPLRTNAPAEIVYLTLRRA